LTVVPSPADPWSSLDFLTTQNPVTERDTRRVNTAASAGTVAHELLALPERHRQIPSRVGEFGIEQQRLLKLIDGSKRYKFRAYRSLNARSI
jgi:hypothetical protein